MRGFVAAEFAISLEECLVRGRGLAWEASVNVEYAIRLGRE